LQFGETCNSIVVLLWLYSNLQWGTTFALWVCILCGGELHNG